jgi:phosphoenolpyruvate carboxylase
VTAIRPQPAPILDGADPTLTRLLLDVLREQGGEELLDVVAQLYAQAGELQHDEAAAEDLEAAVAVLGSDEAMPIVRACSMHLAIANVAADVERVRRSRAAELDGLTAAGSLMRAAQQTRDSGRPTLDVRLVLTAHPTDISRRSVLSKQRVVSTCMEGLDDPRLGPSERRRLEEEISEAMSIWYATNEVRSMRPRVADEVRRLLFFFESVLFDASADLARAFRAPSVRKLGRRRHGRQPQCRPRHDHRDVACAP